MIRCILILLINLAIIFASNARCGEDDTSIANKLYHTTSFSIKMDFEEITGFSNDVLARDNFAVDHIPANIKHLSLENYFPDRLCKISLIPDQINLFTLFQKDIHFLYVLLI